MAGVLVEAKACCCTVDADDVKFNQILSELSLRSEFIRLAAGGTRYAARDRGYARIAIHSVYVLYIIYYSRKS